MKSKQASLPLFQSLGSDASVLEGGHHTSGASTPGQRLFVDTGSWDGQKALGSAGVPAGSKLMALSYQSLQQRWLRGTGTHCVPPG